LEWAASRPTVTATVAAGSPWPQVIRFEDHKRSITINLSPAVMGPPLPASTWLPDSKAGDRTESVAAAHLEKFFRVSLASLGSRIPTLPPATGERWLVATEGKGRLEDHDGTRVLFLSGTPEEMGHQHGVLLKKEIRRVVDRILYGVGVGSSFEKGRWFFGEIEEAVRRTGPFIDPKHLAEMDAIAGASGLEREEVRLANFFPELFHCSGFALLGKATGDGKLYHGRILDYLRGAGLEENAVVMVNRPDSRHAWVNISYAGFTGSVTAMNEKQLSIGEMGGRGEGSWDGKPMAQLVREVMEKCATLEEAIEFMRRTPRTCEYYYVIGDAKSGQAAGIKATAGIFEVVRPGEAHPELRDPLPDTVLLSAGSRYDELVKRVKAGFGGFDAVKSISLMTPPVCMTSNIHSVLFAPGSLDFWVANADSQNVASETRYTPYNLRQLLDAAPAPAKPRVP
jgi:isopenicillin-N N-acyltransferase-like protein